LDEAAVLAIVGDIEQATEFAEVGVAEASESGWSRGKAAGTGTLAFFYLATGRLQQSMKQLELASTEQFSSASYSLAIADTTALAAIAQGDYARAGSALDRALLRRHECEPWYVFTAEHTRLRLLMHRGDFAEAVERAAECARLAREAGSTTWLNAFELARLEASIDTHAFKSSEVPLNEHVRESPLVQIGSLYSIVVNL